MTPVGHERLGRPGSGRYNALEWPDEQQQAEYYAWERYFFERHGFQFGVAFQINDAPDFATRTDNGGALRVSSRRWDMAPVCAGVVPPSSDWRNFRCGRAGLAPALHEYEALIRNLVCVVGVLGTLSSVSRMSPQPGSNRENWR
jgi:hypothetical protein